MWSAWAEAGRCLRERRLTQGQALHFAGKHGELLCYHRGVVSDWPDESDMSDWSDKSDASDRSNAETPFGNALVAGRQWGA
jgi:hypothetical protein